MMSRSGKRASPLFAGRLVGAHCSIAGGLASAARRGAAIGCNTIQIFTKNNNRWDAPPLIREEIDGFQSACLESGIKLAFAHTGYLINLASPDEGLHRRSCFSMLAEIKRAEILELPFIVVHPGSHRGAGEKAGILKAVSSLEGLIEETDGFRVRILLETTAGQGTSLGYKFEHFSEIFSYISAKASKRIGMCVDTAHIFAAGYDIRTEAGYHRTWERFDRLIGREHLRAIHLNDSAKECASRVDRHENLGKGYIGLKSFGMLLNDRRFADLPVVIETPKGETISGDRKNLKLIRRLIEKGC